MNEKYIKTKKNSNTEATGCH